MICCKPGTLLWMRIGKRLRHVRFLTSLLSCAHINCRVFTGIKRTKLRLVRCRARMAMNHRDRVNDARADQNLADVARIPAPWDAKPKHSSPLQANIPLPS